MTVTVEARLEHSSTNRLTVFYVVSNQTDAPIFVLDDMLKFGKKGHVRQPRDLIVREDEDPRTVRFVRGFEPPEATVAVLVIPGAHRLEPGESLRGEAETELPLLSRHPQERPRPLEGEPTGAVVEVGILDRADTVLYPLELEDGTQAFVPSHTDALSNQRLVRGAILPLPK